MVELLHGDCLELMKDIPDRGYMIIFNNIEEVKTIGQIQPNSLINADCLEAMKYIKPKSIDMILCDLPYG